MANEYLVEILLPLYDDKGKQFAPELYETVREELVAEFGGLTAYVRSPALGVWKPRPRARAERDVLIKYEVVVPTLNRRWWARYRRRLEETFHQRELVIRAQRVHHL